MLTVRKPAVGSKHPRPVSPFSSCCVEDVYMLRMSPKDLIENNCLLVALAVALLAVLLQPLQFAMMNVAQGSWPPWPGTRWALRWQQHRRNRLAEAARLPAGKELTDAVVQRAGAAGQQLRRRFPKPDHLLQPTALGNVLAAMHESAGRAYGLDAVTAWPRLYPVLGEQARSLVDDRRDTLDGAVRMAATMAVTAIASLLLLACSGWWVLLFSIPAGITVLAYNAAVQAALAYARDRARGLRSAPGRPARRAADGTARKAGRRTCPEPAVVRSVAPGNTVACGARVLP